MRSVKNILCLCLIVAVAASATADEKKKKRERKQRTPGVTARFVGKLELTDVKFANEKHLM